MLVDVSVVAGDYLHNPDSDLPSMTIADQIARWLDEKGIETVFGIVGGGNTGIFEAIQRLGKTKIISQHHEQAAVMSACGYHRISGRFGVALVTTGAGSTNAITGVVAAWMDSIPLLVISGNEASKYMYAPTRVWGVQGYDSSGMVKDVTKYPSGRCTATNTMRLLEDALVQANKPRQGPVWLDIPKDVQNALV